MTLLNATVTVLEAARLAPESRELHAAIKRMEKRLEVLQARQAKAERRRQWRCILACVCPACSHRWQDSEKFMSLLKYSFSGGIIGFTCPECKEVWEKL